MGGFIASNSREMIETASEIFLQQGMCYVDLISQLGFGIRYFSKIGSSSPIVVSINGRHACACGSIQYGGLVSEKALFAILNDHIDGVLDPTRVRGSWNLILVDQPNAAKVVTSPSGQYHSFYHSVDQKYFVSSSFLACGVTLGSRVSIDPIPALDYICNNAVHSNKTFLKGIRRLPAGCICELDDFGYKVSAYPKVQSNFDIGLDYTSLLKENWSEAFLAMADDGKLKIDISGGLDSRLIAALVKYSGAQHSYNVNRSSNVASQDVEIAQLIAEGEGKSLQVIDYPNRKKEGSWGELRKSFIAYDGLRSVLGKASVAHSIFTKKAQDVDYLIGGHGGELLREYWLAMPIKLPLKKFMERHYTIAGMSSLYSDHVNYHMENAREILGGQSDLCGEKLARLYYEVRMRFWAGTRISVLNKYVSKFSPLNDYHQSAVAIAMDPADKRHAIAEKRVIASLCPVMFAYPSQYGTLRRSATLEDKFIRTRDVARELVRLNFSYARKDSTQREAIRRLGPLDIDLTYTMSEVLDQCQITNVVDARQVVPNIMSLALVLTVLRNPTEYLGVRGV